MSGQPHDDDPLRVTAVAFDAPAITELLATWDAELRARIPGFSTTGGSTVEAGDFTLPAGLFLLATCGGRDLGCGGLRRLDDQTAELKRLFVVSGARGLGVGRTLLGSLEERARSLGYASIRLDTHGGDHPAVRLFRAAGYREVDDYNGNPYARYWFEKRLA